MRIYITVIFPNPWMRIGFNSSFLPLSQAKVIRDKATGLSQIRRLRFVKYTDPISAAKAVEQMNGHRMDGKMFE